jgi:Domain of unknown function (DUF6968)
MELRTVGQVIAERRYVLSSDSGSKKEVIVRIGAPQECPDQLAFYCPFEIVAFETAKIRYAVGIDAVQALRLALKTLGAHLHFYRQGYGDGFYLSEEGDDLGFPEEAWTEGPEHQIVRAFGPLYGMKLASARIARHVTSFQFGTTAPYTLSIRCPWRIVMAQCAWRIPEENLIMTGSGDLRDAAGHGLDWDQSKALGEMFQRDDASNSWINTSDQLILEQVESDDYGGLDIHLSAGRRMQVFPNGVTGEQWALFKPGEESTRFVLMDGVLSGGSPP